MALYQVLINLIIHAFDSNFKERSFEMQMLSVRSEQATTVFLCVFKRTPSKDRLLND